VESLEKRLATAKRAVFVVEYESDEGSRRVRVFTVPEELPGTEARDVLQFGIETVSTTWANGRPGGQDDEGA
jgi:hypothetical protein